MKTIYLKMTLQEPLVISQSNATSGAHQSLEYLPGATLLGAFASKYYVDFKKLGFAEQIFHSGDVRFNNAYPLVEGCYSQPMPMCLHYDKLGDKNQPINYLHQTFNKGEQGKQLRKGFVVTDKTQSQNWLYQPQKTIQMRTAIDQNKGVAQEGLLYGYQMLKAGEKFIAAIDIDSDELIDVLKPKLAQLGEMFIGRSRSAQYGRVTVELADIATSRIKPPVLTLNVDSKPTECLVLWLASDMAVNNEFGQPTLAPTLECLGLKTKGRFISSKSFVRTRQYAPYNGYRRSYDLERQVLVQGSILTYQIDGGLVDSDIEVLKSGLGLYVESGLGQVVLDDSLYLIEKAELKLKPYSVTSREMDVPEPKSALISLLKMKVEASHSNRAQSDFIKVCLDELEDLYRSSRNYNGIKLGQAFGPTKTQWGAIRQFATDAETQNQLMDSLFNDKQGFIRKDKDLWDVSSGEQTFMDWFKGKIEEQSIDTVRAFAFKVTQSKTLLDLMEGKQ